jgi:hypothetical protein
MLSGSIVLFPRTFAILLCVCLPVIAGCGERERYPLSGSVTFKGKPVPFGQIELIPDESQGNQGPRSVVPFRDGRYETPASEFVVGGDYTVRIDGFQYDKTSGGDGEPEAIRLFPPWTSKVALPQTGGQYDFDIPASAGH